MVDWRAIGYGIGVFPIVLIVSLSDAFPWLLVAGLPSGFVAGFRAGGLLDGLFHGAITGAVIAFLFFGGAYHVVTSSSPTPAYPGIGMALSLLFLIAMLLGVESVVAGAIGGLLAR